MTIDDVLSPKGTSITDQFRLGTYSTADMTFTPVPTQSQVPCKACSSGEKPSDVSPPHPDAPTGSVPTPVPTAAASTLERSVMGFAAVALSLYMML